jgi:hypothetical protein
MADVKDLQTNGLVFVPLSEKSTPIRGFRVDNAESAYYDKETEKCHTEYGTAYDEVTFDLAVSELSAKGASGLALLHNYSGTCCIDIDDWVYAEEYLKENYDYDLAELRSGGEHFEVTSPRENRGKFIFLLTDAAKELAIKKVKIQNDSGNDAIDFRGMGNFYDVWPGSTHRATGTPYKHSGSTEIKVMPMDLLKIWIDITKNCGSGSITDSETGESKSLDGGASIDEITREINNGVNLYENLLKLTRHLVGHGTPGETTKQVVKGCMSSCHPSMMPKTDVTEPGRWQKRFNLIDGMVDGAIEKFNTPMDLGSIIGEPELGDVRYREMKWPPGRMGRLCKGLHGYMGRQYQDFGILMGIMAVATVAGRAFNISDIEIPEDHAHTKDVPRALGGAIFCAILGESGSGKGIFEKTLNKLVFDSSGLGINASFILSNDYSSGNNILRDLQSARCGISILDEAGSSLLSQSGDPLKKKAVYLDLWSKCGYDDWPMIQRINGEENKIPRFKGACFSTAMISTPRKFKKAFHQQGSIDDGLAPRTLILTLDPKRGEKNRNIKWEFEGDCLEKYKYLCKMGSSVQATDDHTPHFVWLPEHIRLDAERLDDSYLEEMRELIISDYNKGLMLNRAYEITLRVAMLITAYNKDKTDDNNLMVGDEDWEWAKHFVRYFVDGIGDFFTGKHFGDEMQEALEFVRGNIVNILKGKNMKEKYANMPHKFAKQGMFTKTTLYRRVRNHDLIRSMHDNPSFKGQYKDGLDKVLSILVEDGEIKVLKRVVGLKAKKIFQVTDMFGGMY